MVKRDKKIRAEIKDINNLHNAIYNSSDLIYNVSRWENPSNQRRKYK